MKRRDFLFYTASAAGVLIPTQRSLAAPCPPPQITASSDKGSTSSSPDIILEDDFKGVTTTLPDGTSKLYPDISKWAFTFWPGVTWPDSYGEGTNWLGGNYECQTYVSPFITKIKYVAIPPELRYDPFSIQSDGLHIKASLLSAAQQSAYKVGGYRRFGSGLLITRKTFTYGNIRLVAKLPSVPGTWPAFWLLAESHTWPPEIDIFEAMPWAKHSQQIHTGVIVPKGATGNFGKWADIGFDPSKDFHEYGLNWTATTLTGLLDGKVLWEQPTPASMQQNMYVLINLAVGGKWPFNELGVLPIDGTTTERLTAGSDLIQAGFPAEMIVKSFKVTAFKC